MSFSGIVISPERLVYLLVLQIHLQCVSVKSPYLQDAWPQSNNVKRQNKKIGNTKSAQSSNLITYLESAPILKPFWCMIYPNRTKIDRDRLLCTCQRCFGIFSRRSLKARAQATDRRSLGPRISLKLWMQHFLAAKSLLFIL